MQYNKTADGKYELLKQKNVDTGMGVERTVAVLNGNKSVYDIDILRPIADKVKEIAGIANPDERQDQFRQPWETAVANYRRNERFLITEFPAFLGKPLSPATRVR
jgi:alanyl-tRNA synthetase